MNMARRTIAIACVITSLAGCAKPATNEQTQRPKNANAALTYSVVAADIDKYVGETVAWDGISLDTNRGPKEGTKPVRENYTYLPASDKSGGINFDQPFMFHRLEGEDFRTKAAKRADSDPMHRRRRLIFGTIVGSEEFRYVENGVSKAINAPVLKDVTVDLALER